MASAGMRNSAVRAHEPSQAGQQRRPPPAAAGSSVPGRDGEREEQRLGIADHQEDRGRGGEQVQHRAAATHATVASTSAVPATASGEPCERDDGEAAGHARSPRAQPVPSSAGRGDRLRARPESQGRTLCCSPLCAARSTRTGRCCAAGRRPSARKRRSAERARRSGGTPTPMPTRGPAGPGAPPPTAPGPRGRRRSVLAARLAPALAGTALAGAVPADAASVTARAPPPSPGGTGTAEAPASFCSMHAPLSPHHIWPRAFGHGLSATDPPPT